MTSFPGELNFSCPPRAGTTWRHLAMVNGQLHPPVHNKGFKPCRITAEITAEMTAEMPAVGTQHTHHDVTA